MYPDTAFCGRSSDVAQPYIVRFTADRRRRSLAIPVEQKAHLRSKINSSSFIRCHTDSSLHLHRIGGGGYTACHLMDRDFNHLLLPGADLRQCNKPDKTA